MRVVTNILYELLGLKLFVILNGLKIPVKILRQLHCCTCLRYKNDFQLLFIYVFQGVDPYATASRNKRYKSRWESARYRVTTLSVAKSDPFLVRSTKVQPTYVPVNSACSDCVIRGATVAPTAHTAIFDRVMASFLHTTMPTTFRGWYGCQYISDINVPCLLSMLFLQATHYWLFEDVSSQKTLKTTLVHHRRLIQFFVCRVWSPY